MKEIELRLEDEICPITVGDGVLDHAGALVQKALGGNPGGVLIITNETVAPLYLKRLTEAFSRQNLEVHGHILPDGERFKTAETVASIYTEAARLGLDRSSLFVALGGGVVGDLAGFAAATFMRGCHFVQVPTSLLAMVDASIGGKTGYDLPEGKNLVGAFKQPKTVLIDPLVLQTLPGEEVACGKAESIKHGIVASPSLFEAYERSDQVDVTQLLMESARVKVDIVQQDPFEQGPRAWLNLGHTFGHGIELVSGFTVKHGQAVGAGLGVAARLGVLLGLCSNELVRRIEGTLRLHGLEVHLDGLPLDDVLNAMILDKKKAGNQLRFVVPRDIGKVELVSNPDQNLVKDALRSVLKG